MHFSLISLFIIAFLVLSLLLLFVLAKYFKLKKTFNLQKRMQKSILKTINSVRYGNIHERVNQDAATVLPELSEGVDRMIEAIVDREKMIVEYQNDLNKKIEALKEIEQIKEDFVATLTHDLKVPILAEKNILILLLGNKFGELNEAQKEALKHLENSNKELIELVEIILETYKLNETEIELNKENLDIKRILENAIDEMRPISDSDSISINFYPHFSNRVCVDEFYIKRVFKNLILNAISFSNSNGVIDISLSDYEDNVYVKITNYGKCIKKEEIDHVFDKYYTTTKKFRKVGTGLGLYLSNQIVKSHNGDIFIESEDGEHRYTTIVIRLPKQVND